MSSATSGRSTGLAMPALTAGDWSRPIWPGMPHLLSTLKESEMLSHVVPPVRLSPEGELRLLQDAQQRARTKLLVVAGSIAAGAVLLFAAFAGVLWVFMSGRMS